MRQERSTILYLFVIAIVLIGIILLIFKDNLASRYLNYGGTGEVFVVKPENNALNLDILRDSRIKALKGYASIFDYENLDKTQDALVEVLKVQNEVIISNPEDKASSSEENNSKKNIFTRVRVGNSNPFVVDKIAK